MKRFVLAVVLSASLTSIVGCKKEEAPPPPVAGQADATQVQTAFAHADPTVKGELDVGVSLIKAGDYQGGIRKLQALAANIKLTPEQQQALRNYISQLQANMGGALRDAAGGMSNAATSATDAAKQMGRDLQQSVGK